MTVQSKKIDFTTVNCRLKEVPAGLPPLSKYKPTGIDDAVVIDAGSWQFRAGYSSKELPALVFDPIIHRYQTGAGEPAQFYIGRTAPSGMTRASCRPLYEDGNVILQPASLEHIFDNIFTRLSVQAKDEHICHPVFMTEVVGNPPYCRRETAELLFEAYGTAKACFAVDGPLAWYANVPRGLKSGLLIVIGEYTTVITAIIEGQVRPEHVRKINFGGHVASKMMLQLMQCKYPTFPLKMTLWQAQEVVQRSSRVALEYDATLLSMAQSDVTLAEHDVIVQFPYSFESLEEKQKKEEAKEQLAEKRREQAQKLRERAEKQRSEKQEAKRQQIESMKKLERQVLKSANYKVGEFNDEEEEASIDQLHLFGYESLEELQAAIVTEQRELNRMLGIEEVKEAPDYSLLDVPDAELSAEQIKEKRKQRLLKNSADARERIRREKEEETRRIEEQKLALEERRINDFAGWRDDLYGERQDLIKVIRARQKKKEALSDRRSQAAGARLRDVVSLVVDEDEEPTPQQSVKKRKSSKKDVMAAVKQEEEGFGDDDADWLIYRQINRDDEEEGEKDEEIQKRLGEIEEQLEQYDNEGFYKVLSTEMINATSLVDKLRDGITKEEGEETNAIASQLHVNVERFRVVEGLFQPGAILGLDQAGLVEAIEDILKLLPPDTQDTLSSNILITGSAGQFEGLKERLDRELRSVLRVDAPLSIRIADDPALDTWKGAALLCRQEPDSIPWITKEWYHEHGGERLFKHSWYTNPS